jgi:ATP-dependent protease HslVU (ClpYQ) peptidase subunit
MTTIAYRDGVMAADTQVTEGNMVFAQATKLRRLADGTLIGMAGDMMPCAKLLRAIDGKGFEDIEPIAKDCKGAWALVVNPERRVFMLQGGKAGGLAELHGDFFVEGSGAPYALGAMAAGAGAKQAVEIAARFDVNTGLPVVVENLGVPVVVEKPVRRRGTRRT